jgi:hypothetical protein
MAGISIFRVEPPVARRLYPEEVKPSGFLVSREAVAVSTGLLERGSRGMAVRSRNSGIIDETF